MTKRKASTKSEVKAKLAEAEAGQTKVYKQGLPDIEFSLVDIAGLNAEVSDNYNLEPESPAQVSKKWFVDFSIDENQFQKHGNATISFWLRSQAIDFLKETKFIFASMQYRNCG